MLPISSFNASHFLKDRELGKKTPLEDIKHLYISNNMLNEKCNVKEFICYKDNYQQKGSLIAFAVQDQFIVTAGRDGEGDTIIENGMPIVRNNHSISLWDLETKKCRWTFYPDCQVRWSGMIKIINGNIICTGCIKVSLIKEYTTIHVIDFQSGLKKAFIDDKNLKKICIIGEHIFGKLENGNIKEWDIEGKPIKIIRSENLQYDSTTPFLGLGNFLVHASQNIILIHNIEKNKFRKLLIKPSKTQKHELEMDIQCASIKGTLLFCGFSRYVETALPDCCMIDLETETILKQYRATHSFLHQEIDRFTQEPFLSDTGTIFKILSDKNFVYLGLSNGKIIAVNLEKNTHEELAQHNASIHYLAIENDILISGSPFWLTAEIVFWDLKSHKELARKEIACFNDLLFSCGKVIVAIKEKFILWDYLASTTNPKWGVDQLNSHPNISN